MERFIAEASTNKLVLPTAFRVVMQVVDKDGKPLTLPQTVGVSPIGNFNYQKIGVHLDGNAMNDKQAHLVFQFLSAESVPKGMDTKVLDSKPPEYKTCFAFAFLMLYHFC